MLKAIPSGLPIPSLKPSSEPCYVPSFDSSIGPFVVQPSLVPNLVPSSVLRTDPGFVVSSLVPSSSLQLQGGKIRYIYLMFILDSSQHC